MTIRHKAKLRRTTAVVLASVVAFALAGCSGDSGKAGDGSPKASKATNGQRADKEEGSPAPEPTETLAQVKGDRDIVVAITRAKRDSGGFVTVEGTITNNGDAPFSPSQWKGSEQELNNSGPSVAGAALVDSEGKKRYYVLRDTEGRCLCTMRISTISAKQTIPFFAQFPAPPEDVTKVQFQLPTMPPAQIEISK